MRHKTGTNMKGTNMTLPDFTVTTNHQNRVADNFYHTRDLYLAAALVTLGHKIVSPWRNNGQVTFMFDLTDKIREDARAYWSHNLTVDPLTYAMNIKTTKQIIFEGEG